MKALKWIGLFEVGLFYFLVHWVIWKGGKYRPTILVISILIILICLISNYFHSDSREKIGFSLNSFWPNFRDVGPAGILISLPFFAISWGKELPVGWNIWFALIGYPIWAFAQEYVLLSFIGNRLSDSLPHQKNLIPWINGMLFSLTHFPNPILMTATFIGGIVFTWAFLRNRNLISISLIHGLIGVAISLGCADIPGAMSVGPGYLKRVGKTPHLPIWQHTQIQIR
ncbi:MAG: type II CAAX prenyl endopeptidase Rce1 family protein [Elusimicrobiota bacterium]